MPKKKKTIEARCINCIWYAKYKQFCKKHKIPTKRFNSCFDIERYDILVKEE